LDPNHGAKRSWFPEQPGSHYEDWIDSTIESIQRAKSLKKEK